MLHKGIISRSTSGFTSPIVLVDKKNSLKKRMCINFIKLNAKTIKEGNHLPDPEEFLRNIGKSKYFSKIDLETGYWQVPLHPKSKKFTAFSSPWGTFEFNYMPFGLCNAANTFQKLMNIVLGDLLGEGCFVYIDDIIVYAKSEEEHNKLIQEILQRITSNNLRINWNKSEFLKEKILFCGHMLDKEGVSIDREKISKIDKLAFPFDS